jgi:hypothetical protein
MFMRSSTKKADIPGLVDLYAKIDRMRDLSSAKVVDIADSIARKILDTCLKPNKGFTELPKMVNGGSVHLMREFSTAARGELATLRTL